MSYGAGWLCVSVGQQQVSVTVGAGPPAQLALGVHHRQASSHHGCMGAAPAQREAPSAVVPVPAGSMMEVDRPMMSKFKQQAKILWYED